MTTYLSEAWLGEHGDPMLDAFAGTGGAGTVARTVTGSPDGELRYTATVADGTVAYAPGLVDGADLALIDTYANVSAVVAGELDPNTLFMRGQTKVVGDVGLLLKVLSATKTPQYETARAASASVLDGA